MLPIFGSTFTTRGLMLLFWRQKLVKVPVHKTFRIRQTLENHSTHSSWTVSKTLMQYLIANENKNQRYLTKGGIAFVFARWQQQFAIACFAWRFNPQISPAPGGGAPGPHLTQCAIGPYMCICQMASKSVRGTNVTDRQTDHATEKCVGIGRIACAARSDSA